MELSPGQRRTAFAVVVIVLAALGYYLIVPAVRHSSARPQAAAPASPSVSSAAPAAAGTGPAASASAPPAGDVNIYSWLPFTQQDLSAAASVTMRFSVAYNTFTYNENAAAYVAAMHGLITSQLATTLRDAYQTPGVAQLRSSQKQVSTGTAQITSLRAFGASSMTFTVAAGQQLVTSDGTSNGSANYAVTVTGSGSSWQVSDIELQSAGNT